MWNSKPPILICEDDDNDIIFLQRTFEKVGITNPAHIAHDGAEALLYLEGKDRYANRNIYPFPTMVITDLKMPRRNGFDILQWLKSHPECAVIPVIVWTSSIIESDVKKAYELGANCYMQKPSQLNAWEAKIRLIFEFWSACEIPRLNLSVCAERNPPEMQ